SRIRARTVRLASIRRLLSPPPMRRDWPPASSRPQTCGLALLGMAELREARRQPDRLAAGNFHHQRAILSVEVVEILHDRDILVERGIADTLHILAAMAVAAAGRDVFQ